MNPKKESRRSFIKTAALGAAGLTVGLNARAYSNIMGANDRLRFGVAGLNSRGNALVAAALSVPNAEVSYLCDVDIRAAERAAAKLVENGHKKPKIFTDIRKMVAEKDMDVLGIASPDHWHTPMSIMALEAGKHVYVEKPCCHVPAEGELLVKAQKKYGKLVQMGNQQRSGLATIQAIGEIHNGIIGDVYFGKAWYANRRGSIGLGKAVPVPEWLDWELWQGPAPRRKYKDNWVHYNWHWFWNWGTGEINNNGTHEIDICRWALDVNYPIKVNSSGGRFHFQDDWEFYDTQLASFEFEGGKMITWEGKSCNNHKTLNRGRGVTVHGTEGTVMMDRNGYTIWDQAGEVVKEVKEKEQSATTDLVGIGSLDQMHMNNLANGIRKGETLNAPIDDAYISNLLPHLGNIAQECGGAIETDPKNGHVLNNPKGMEMWSRDYEPGWEPKV